MTQQNKSLAARDSIPSPTPHSYTTPPALPTFEHPEIKLHSISAAAKLMNMSDKWVRDQIYEGKLAAVHRGNRWYITLQAMRNFIADHEIGGGR